MSDLVTARLVLHPMTIGEAEAVVRGESSRSAHWAPGYPTDGDVLAARRFLGTCADTGDPQPFGNYEIGRRDDGQAIGGLGFHGPADAVAADERVRYFEAAFAARSNDARRVRGAPDP
jgi:hypothetical protein